MSDTCTCGSGKMNQKFLFSDKAVDTKPVNPDFVITFEKNNDSANVKGKYQIIFAVADQGTKARDIIWYFVEEEDRNKAYDNIKCLLGFPV
jgi:hypothetical protein